MRINHKIIPHLWFDDDAEEAVNFYLSIFDNSTITALARYGDAGPGPKGKIMSIGFTLNGQEFAAINGGPIFKMSEAVSFLIWCDTQEEIDALWVKLVEGGTPQRCGWLKDRFGMVWQVNWSGMPAILGGPDTAAASRTTRTMMTMQKIDIRALQAAAAAG